MCSQQDLRVRTGGFRVTVPRENIQAAALGEAPWWALAGVHSDRGGRWIVTAGRGPLVRMDLSPPVQGAMFRFRPTIRRLEIGLEDGAAFLAQLGLGGKPRT